MRSIDSTHPSPEKGGQYIENGPISDTSTTAASLGALTQRLP
jgi:hypothetical protein